MDVTEVAQLCFQEVVAEAKIQVVEEGSEDKISLEMDFLLSESQNSPVNTNHTSKHVSAPPTPHTLLLSNSQPK